MATRYCQLCGQAITQGGKLYQHPAWTKRQQLRVCAECQASKPRCRECGLPMADEMPGGVCPTCLQQQGVCRACDICGAPVTDQRWQLSDGRISCADCHASAVYTPAAATALFRQVQAFAETLGLTLNIPTGLALADRRQLAEIIQEQLPAASPGDGLDPRRTLGLYARRGLKRGIYIQSGLPRNLLLQITAHEFAHAWQGENCPLLDNPLVREGFAEWLAYSLLGSLELSKEQRQMTKRSDLYGDGLRWAQQTVTELGLPGLLAACRGQT
jgi:hypothetical protein